MARQILYFDSSVYGFIDDAGEADSVRAWLDGSRRVVITSHEAVVGEALRIPDAEARARRVRTITTVARRPSRLPIDLASADELLGEVLRLRPAWVRRIPSRA